MSRTEDTTEDGSRRSVAELLAQYGETQPESPRRRRRRAPDAEETAPQSIIDRVLPDGVPANGRPTRHHSGEFVVPDSAPRPEPVHPEPPRVDHDRQGPPTPPPPSVPPSTPGPVTGRSLPTRVGRRPAPPVEGETEQLPRFRDDPAATDIRPPLSGEPPAGLGSAAAVGEVAAERTGAWRPDFDDEDDYADAPVVEQYVDDRDPRVDDDLDATGYHQWDDDDAHDADGFRGADALRDDDLRDDEVLRDDDDYVYDVAGDRVPSGRRALDDESGDAESASPAREWMVMVGQVGAGVLGGALLWLICEWLWQAIPVVALIVALAVITGLVWVVRRVRRAEDLQTTVIAVLVGLFVTVSPAALLLVGQ